MTINDLIKEVGYLDKPLYVYVDVKKFRDEFPMSSMRDIVKVPVVTATCDFDHGILMLVIDPINIQIE